MIACSVQKRREKVWWILPLTCDTHDVTGSRHKHVHTYISSYRWTRETRQVPAERPVLSLEHNQVWSRTTEGVFCCKHCKFKSGFCFALLATFCHCRDFTCQPSSSDMFCTLDFLFSVGACLIFVAITECKIGLLPSMAIHISGMTRDACAADHVNQW